jgi:DNA-binding HxlR family transcriptional regulator
VGFKESILNGLGDGKYTITDIMKSIDAVNGLSNQRVSALVRQMVADGLLVREEIKRKAYFSRA